MPRIVSLLASATEMVCSLGLKRDLVGRSHECDYPPTILELPVCTMPRFDVHGSSVEIDRRVKESLQTETSVYHVDAELLRQLRPDVIITQAQCEVCAVSFKDVEQAVCSWHGSRPRIVTLKPDCLEDVWSDIAGVAVALQVPDRGSQLLTALRQRIQAIAQRVRGSPQPPRVACLEWLDPLMASGNWMPELVSMAGGVNLFGSAGKHSPWLSWDQLRQHDPDIIVALPCGFDLARTRQEMEPLTRRTDWQQLRAVQTGRVFITDGNQFFNRPGPRLVESLEILAEIFHPQGFHFGHEGTGWERAAT
jgi:iron complex transport system substrate-binding protein